ncbi:Uncharacterized protein TCM_003655 [Theobroma cacao]|uniref:Uncharacterized protein n=1 Tax=Theobroma cacao TaxID=3641 RepID=A0A061DW47_THECC|nr:Uncharacterized protein TCM_003655 [Theobroma cacao]
MTATLFSFYSFKWQHTTSIFLAQTDSNTAFLSHPLVAIFLLSHQHYFSLFFASYTTLSSCHFLLSHQSAVPALSFSLKVGFFFFSLSFFFFFFGRHSSDFSFFSLSFSYLLFLFTFFRFLILCRPHHHHYFFSFFCLHSMWPAPTHSIQKYWFSFLFYHMGGYPCWSFPFFFYNYIYIHF